MSGSHFIGLTPLPSEGEIKVARTESENDAMDTSLDSLLNQGELSSLIRDTKQEIDHQMQRFEKEVIAQWEEWIEILKVMKYIPYHEEHKEDLRLREMLSSTDQLFPSSGPRVLKGTKTPFFRPSKDYYAILNGCLQGNFPMRSPGKFLTALVALANLHHIRTWVAEHHVEIGGLIEHINKRVEENVKGDLRFLSTATNNIADILQTCFNPLTDVGKAKRLIYKQSLPIDVLTPDNIKKYQEKKLEIVYVNVDAFPETKKTNLKKKYPIPALCKTLTSDSLIVDAKSKKILGVFKKKALEGDALKKHVLTLKRTKEKHGSYLNHSARSKLKKPEHEKMNKGSQSSIGYIRYDGKPANHSTTTTQKCPDLLKSVEELAVLATVSFKEFLPIAAATAIAEVKDLGIAGFLLAKDTPFSVASINIKNEVGNHRDHNAGNYSAMYVTRLDDNPLLAGTCFPELKCTSTGLPLEIIGDDGDLIIADTDFVHCVRNVTTERVTYVLYTNKSLLVSPTFASDSDDELDFPEEKESKSSIHLKSGNGTLFNKRNAASDSVPDTDGEPHQAKRQKYSS